MPRRFRCKYTLAHRCKETATARLRLTFSIVSAPQFTRVCEPHALSLEAMCLASNVKFERV